MEGKEILLQILNNGAIASDSALLEGLRELTLKIDKELALVNEGKEHYITVLSDAIKDGEVFDKVTNLLVDADKNVFKARLEFINGLREISGENQFILTAEQETELNKFILLLKEASEKFKLRLDLMEKVDVSESEVERIKKLLDADELFMPDDYYAAMNIVKSYNPALADTNWDKVVTFLNSYNGQKLKKFYEEKQKADGPVRAKFTNPEEDIFSHKDVLKKPSKPVSEIEKIENRQKVKEIMASIGFDFDKLPQYYQDKLLIADVNELKEMAIYLNDNGYIKKIGINNERGICEVLTGANVRDFVSIIDALKNGYKLQDREINNMLGRGTVIFTRRGFKNFRGNANLLTQYGVSLNFMIYRAIIFLFGNAKNQANLLEYLENMGINCKKFLEKCGSVLTDGGARIKENINTLINYGFSISESDDNSLNSYTVLKSNDLATALDQFIELGLNEYIHNSPTAAVKSIKELIVKRIYYAFKNNLPVWKTYNTEQSQLNGEIVRPDGYSEEEVNAAIPDQLYSQNSMYNSWIAEEKTPSEEEILILLADYPNLEMLEEGHRLAIYTDSRFAQIKRKTEFMFGNKVISRLKTYRAFNALIKHEVDPNEALKYAITYNSILSDGDLEMIKKSLYGGNEEVKSL